MKTSTLIATHLCVFAIGIAAAFMIGNNRQADGDSQSTASAGPNSNSDSRRSFSTEEDSSNHKRDSAARRDATAKIVKPATQRLTDISRITDEFERQRALMDLLETLAPSEFEAVAETYRELDHLGNSGDEYKMILSRWAKADPLSALSYVDKHPNSQQGRNTILTTWADSDPASAERWAIANHKGDGPNPHLAAVIAGVAPHDLNEALRMALTMPRSGERGEAMRAITSALFLKGADAAMAFPDSVTDEALRGGFIAEISGRLLGKDPLIAAAWIASMQNGNLQNRASRQVAEALARDNVTTAGTWVKSLKPEAQVEAARGVIPLMSARDIAGTAQWVTSLAGAPNYDRAVEEFVWSCNTRAPEQSAAWIQGVTNPDTQRRLYHRMLGEWARSDGAAVKQWVASNQVPADIRRRFSR